MAVRYIPKEQAHSENMALQALVNQMLRFANESKSDKLHILLFSDVAHVQMQRAAKWLENLDQKSRVMFYHFVDGSNVDGSNVDDFVPCPTTSGYRKCSGCVGVGVKLIYVPPPPPVTARMCQSSCEI